ncbi:Clp protease N-terminal domain-containing protein [Sphaerisporangium corydalis]|uniref:Clp protease N-terminal domain-containing protein n=1 Tax=Sphaerisporangium corydalis TaxID=1441875 RepID=A0ABV9ED47_9ACTN|nr:Clp protease N-terminal domain-containing protein [Sphaerisporangium corydalis]
MPKINVYLPDDLAEAVKESGVPVSAICQRALEQAVRRVTAIRETTLGDLDVDDPTQRLAAFTGRARVVLRLAIDQARAGGAPSVGTEHLLGGMLAEGGNLALQVLRAMEIDPERVGRDLAGVTAENAGEGVTARHFSGSAANALELTVTEATALGHNYVGCEHLLLGLVTEPDGTAGQVLRALGAEPRLTRRAVNAALVGYVHLRAQGQTGATAAADAAKALAAAVRQELQPVTQRLERLEERLGMPAEG